jgi:hypothetical protein
MKKILFIFFLLGFIIELNAQLMDWQKIGVFDFDKIEIAPSGSFYAIDEYSAKTFKSVDEGFTWELILNYQNASALEITDHDTVFIGTSAGKLLVSENRGTSFQIIKTFPSGIRSIKFTRINNDHLLLIGTNSDGLFLSSDFGLTWNEKKFTNSIIRDIEVAGERIFAGTYGNGLFISDDRGLTWSQRVINSAAENIYDIEFAESKNLIFISSDKIYKSTDWGINLTAISNFYAFRIRYSELENEIFAGQYRSKDEGNTWEKVFPISVYEIAVKDSITYIVSSDGDLYNEELNPYKGENYFPLSIGNKWQHLKRYSHTGVWTTVTYSLSTLIVLKDTLINGNLYYKMSKNGNDFFLSYSEDNKLYRFHNSSEVLLMDFNLKWGQTFLYFNNTDGHIREGYDSLFGKKIYMKGFDYSTNPNSRYYYRFADSLGEYYYYNYEHGPMGQGSTSETVLIQAEINFGDSVYYHKKNYQSAIQHTVENSPDSALIVNLTASHPIDRKGSEESGSVYFIDEADLEYFFSKDSTLISSERISLNLLSQNKFSITLAVPDSASNKNYNFYYRFYVRDKGIIPGETIFPPNGFFSHTLAITDLPNEDLTPINFYLSQNYPNPFNPTTKIKFSIPTSPPTPLLNKERGRGEVVTLKVYDVLGNAVATLVNEQKSPGEYEVEFDGSNFSSGIYFYQLKTGSFTSIKKMIYLK